MIKYTEEVAGMISFISKIQEANSELKESLTKTRENNECLKSQVE